MRILIFCQLYPPLVYGGGEVLLSTLADSLVTRGHHVHVITQRVRGASNLEVSHGVSIERVGRPLDYSGALTTSFLDSLGYFVGAILAGVRHISRNQVDVIHSNTYVPALAGQFCAMLFGKKHVITVHDVYLLTMPWFWKKWSTQPRVSALARYLGAILETIILRLPVAAIHTVSQTSKRDLIQAGARVRIQVVSNAIDIHNYALLAVEPHPHQAIFIGRLVFYKNLEVVFRALHRVLHDVPDAKLVVVGDGVMRGAWEALTHELGLKAHVNFRDRVAHEEKIRLLEESAFLVLPSLVEGFGIVVLEAFACRKPVLASSIGALRELVTDGVDGYIIHPLAEDEWAKRMLELFNNPQGATNMGAKGRGKLLQRYSIDRISEEMLQMYASVLSGDDGQTPGLASSPKARGYG